MGKGISKRGNLGGDMDKHNNVIQQIVEEAKKDTNLMKRIELVLDGYKDRDIPHNIIEDTLSNMLSNDHWHKLNFVRIDIGRVWGILENTLTNQGVIGMTKATQEILARSKNSEGVIHSVINLMLSYEGTHDEPSGYELRKVFYGVLFMPGMTNIEHNNQDLQNSWELICKHLTGNSETKPEEQPQEENIMSDLTNVPHVTIDYVYGVDIKAMDKADIMAAIVRVKEEIKDLNDVGVESKYIKDQVTDLEAVVKTLVTHLDQ